MMTSEPMMAAYVAPATLHGQQNSIDMADVWTMLSTLTAEQRKEVRLKLEEEESVKMRFESELEMWWKSTCLYSGPSKLFYNDHLANLMAIGREALPFLEEAIAKAPDYKHRHLHWLRDTLRASYMKKCEA